MPSSKGTSHVLQRSHEITGPARRAAGACARGGGGAGSERRPAEPDGFDGRLHEPAAVGRGCLRPRVRRAVAAGRRTGRSLWTQTRARRRPPRVLRRSRTRRALQLTAGIDRTAGPDGCRRRAGHADHVVDHHDVLPQGTAGQGGRGLDRGGRCWGGPRPADLGHPARDLGVAVGVLVQRGGGSRGCRSRRPSDPELTRGEPAPRRLRGWAALRRHPGRSGLRCHRGTRAWLGRPGNGGSLRRGCGRPGGLGVVGPEGHRPDPRPAPLRAAGLHHGCGLDRSSVLRVLRVHLPGDPVRPARAGLLRPPGRSGPDPDGHGVGRSVPAGSASGRPR